MKRNRADITSTTMAKHSIETTAKPQRRRNDGHIRATARSKTSPATESPNSDNGGVKTESPVSIEELKGSSSHDEVSLSWDSVAGSELGAGAGGGVVSWWMFSGGVEEDKLLGWFPFVDEDFFPCSENRGAEDECFYHDIWQLQHINEVPSVAK